MGYPRLATLLHTERGSRVARPLELPWLDVELAFLVAVNRVPGDDVGIALDYRTDRGDPRVVASDWGSGRRCVWREVTTTFTDFVRVLGLSSVPPSNPGASTDRGGK